MPVRWNSLCCAAIAMFYAGAISAADRQPIDRNLLLQQQQSDAFGLRSRQAAEELRARSSNADDRTDLQTLHADQRRQQDALHSQQLRRLDSGRIAPDTLTHRAARRAEQARMEQERAAQRQHFDAQDIRDRSESAIGDRGPRRN